jgi:hypothetical protein
MHSILDAWEIPHPENFFLEFLLRNPWLREFSGPLQVSNFGEHD